MISKFVPLPVLESSPTPPDRAPAKGRTAPLSPTGGAKHVELAPIHDFAAKLRQAEVLPRLKDYVRWQARQREDSRSGRGIHSTRERDARVPDHAPLSINLDITTACNFACDHCVDMDILNTGIKYDHAKLIDSLALMARNGLRSVIVIGGGEPTVYPKFVETIRFMKSLGLQVAVVTNGSGMKKIEAVADVLEETDWVRLSLDSASDEVFQAMHKPKKRITLDEICADIGPVKDRNPRFKIGFSFIITWKGAFINDTHIVENLHEIVPAAKRARDWRFDYIAYKPFLTRAEANNAEIVDLKESAASFDEVVARIRASVDEAKRYETDAFRVYETTNLKVLENRSYRNYTRQPHTCHMQFFRQVLSPLGMYNCPVYRNQPHGQVGDKEAYASDESYERTRRQTAERIAHFDATVECQEVTCLYNHANWWIEDLIAHPEKLEEIEAASLRAPDFFL
jgi:molybdenum cofactor biosynthesis enzyme MoaA